MIVGVVRGGEMRLTGSECERSHEITGADRWLGIPPHLDPSRACNLALCLIRFRSLRSWSWASLLCIGHRCGGIHAWWIFIRI